MFLRDSIHFRFEQQNWFKRVFHIVTNHINAIIKEFKLIYIWYHACFTLEKHVAAFPRPISYFLSCVLVIDKIHFILFLEIEPSQSEWVWRVTHSLSAVQPLLRFTADRIMREVIGLRCSSSSSASSLKNSPPYRRQRARVIAPRSRPLQPAAARKRCIAQLFLLQSCQQHLETRLFLLWIWNLGN